MLWWQLELGDKRSMSSFDEWFQCATGNAPFPYQRRFAEAREIAQLVDAPV
jgi:hypothetical protein